jgi:hypothetical protein
MPNYEIQKNCHISPKNKTGFIGALKAINPKIEVMLNPEN